MSYKHPYRRNSSTDHVWTPAELQRITKLSTETEERVEEYAPRLSGDDPQQPSSLPGSISKKASTGTNQQQKQKLQLDEVKNSVSYSRGSTQTQHTKKLRMSSYRRYSGGGDHPSILMDWNNTAAWHYLAGFNLELWWRRSAVKQRVNAGLIMLLVIIFLMHFFFGLWCIWTFARKPIRSPYMCQTQVCVEAGQWIGEFFNESESPCNNFYQYVCGNAHFEEEDEGAAFDFALSLPTFSIEFGEDSILANILKDYRHDPKWDKSIEYYRGCLAEPTRQKFGLDALLETYGDVLGTRDLTTFETSSISLEEVGSRMFQRMGHASFITVAFYVYPFVQILRPHEFTKLFNFKDGDPLENQKLVELVFEGLLPFLGVPKGSVFMKDMVQGVNMITSIINIIEENLAKIKMPKKANNYGNPKYKNYVEKVKEVLFDTDYCPPFNITLDMERVLWLWLKEDGMSIDFLDLMSLKYFHTLQICFDLDRSSYVPINPTPKDPWTYKFTYPRTAFVAFWILQLFWSNLFSTDTAGILNAWGINNNTLPENREVHHAFRYGNTDTELRCLDDLWINLGYVPSTRYLLATQSDPVEYINTVETHLQDLFIRVSDIFNRIPNTEISTLWQFLGNITFHREMYIDFIMPLPNGLLDNSGIDDELPFTQDHLRNTLIAVKYTVESSRFNWLGATNTQPTAKWWGEGDPYGYRSQLLDLKAPMVISAPFKEEVKAAVKEKWETFLGYPHTNYVLFPISMVNEPHLTETLAIHYAGSHVKQIRTFLRLVTNPTIINKFKPDELLLYPSLKDRFTLLHFGNPKTDNDGTRACSQLHTRFHYERKKVPMFKYTMESSNTFEYNWHNFNHYFNVLALKEAFRLFREERRQLHELPYNWTLTAEQRTMRMQRFLLGDKVSKFTEEQLFFLAYVRHVCRGSWKTHSHADKKLRYFLEAEVLSVLMQTEEFARVWNCGRNSFMNNNGKERCIRWMP